MFSRLVYGVFIWYEFVFKLMDYTIDKKVVTNELAFYIGSGFYFFLELVDMTCAEGRLLTQLPFLLPFIIFFIVSALNW
jgi:hypothetical protein